MKKLMALASLVCLLAACTSLPTEGPVNATRAPTDTGQSVGLHATAPRPEPTPKTSLSASSPHPPPASPTTSR